MAMATGMPPETTIDSVGVADGSPFGPVRRWRSSVTGSPVVGLVRRIAHHPSEVDEILASAVGVGLT